jgi:hypothetical protein
VIASAALEPSLYRVRTGTSVTDRDGNIGNTLEGSAQNSANLVISRAKKKSLFGFDKFQQDTGF